jgi:hypothetical protein
MKRILGISIVMLILTACSTLAPRFINHNKPDVSLDVAAFDKAGCPPDQYGFRKCEKDSPLYALGCDEIREPSSILGALKPAYSIMQCITFRDHILFDEILPIEESLQENCNTAPDKVCLEETDFISETVKEECARTQSMVCATYHQVLQEKCLNTPAEVCDFLKGPYQIRMEVEDKILHVNHVVTGTYTYPLEGSYFFSRGGLFPVLIRYVIFQDNHFVLLKNENDFRKIFAPLENPDEALAYVQAITGGGSSYGLKFDPHYEYFVDVIEDTHIDPVADGYVVYLYQKDVLGCGPHLTHQITIHVTGDGIVQQRAVKQVFKNPAEDGMCVD